MIFVERTACPNSLNPDDPNSAGSKELAAAKAHLKEHGKPPANAFYHAYGGDDVRTALTDMFSGKCGYCETETVAGSDGDIEHYRPKGGVSSADAVGFAHPGYWWLAMVWSNLLLSCAHCNQERRKIAFRSGMTEEEIRAEIEKNDRRTTGKKNQFPTAGNKWVTSPKKKISGEKPLLIDPTATDPEPLFEWFVSGQFSTIAPRNGDPRASETIRVLDLNRHRLTEARGRALGVMILLQRNVREGLRDMQQAATDGEAKMAMRAVKRDVLALKALCAPDKPYAALAKTYLKEVETMVATAL